MVSIGGNLMIRIAQLVISIVAALTLLAFAGPASAAGNFEKLVKDILADACGDQMRGANFRYKLEKFRGDKHSYWAEGFIRLSKGSISVDSKFTFFVAKTDDPFINNEYYLRDTPMQFQGFSNEGGLRTAMGCKGRLRGRFDIDFYERKLKL
jgi:hypothetical protein